MAICSRFEKLQRQRKKSGGRKDAGHAFVTDAGGRLGGKYYSSSSARGRGKRREGRGRGGRRSYNDREEEEQKAASGRAGGGKADTDKGSSTKCKRCGGTGHKSVRCPDQICGVCGGKGHLVEVCANVVTVLAYENTKSSNDESDAAISGEEEGAFVCDMSGECSDESNDEGVVVRSLDRWGISRLYAIVRHRVTCPTQQPE